MRRLTADPEAVRVADALHAFLASEVAAHYDDWEHEGLMPRELFRKLGRAGFLGVDVPTAEGGPGGAFVASAEILYALSRAGYAGLASAIAAHNEVAIPYVRDLGTDAQRARYLAPMVRGDVLGAIAMTEPSAGSDLKAIRMTAVKTPNGYRLDGQKTFITNGIHAELVIVAAKTDPAAGAKGISLFLVDASAKDFSRGRKLEKLGQKTADTAELYFDGVEVGNEALLGGEGNGFACLMKELPRERLSFAITALGACDAAMASTLAYLAEDRAAGGILANEQHARFALGSLHARIEVFRAFTAQCVARQVRGTLGPTDVSAAKLVSSELQGEVVETCLRLVAEAPASLRASMLRACVDARGQRIYGGTSEIMRELLARELLGR